MFQFTEPSSCQIQNTVEVHSASAHTMGSHTVYKLYQFLTLIINICCVIDWINYCISFFSLYYWRSLVLVYTQSHNTHQAFLHNAKYFFKSLYYNSGTVTARSCTIFSKCNKLPDMNFTQLKTFDKCIYAWVFSLFLKENILITYM